MSAQTSRILLLGLENSLAAELASALEAPNCRLSSAPLEPGCDPLEAIEETGANLVFCPAEPAVFRQVIAAVQPLGSAPAVVAVSRHPEVSDWLDAIEAGASDYCGAPFEPHAMRWILETNLRRAA